MTTTHAEYLERLAQKTAERETEDAYLWPRTPIANIQAEIWSRCGHTDYTKLGRVGPILNTLRELIVNKLLRDEFTYLDMCTGDALIPWQVKREFPFATCYAIDIVPRNARRLATTQGVQLYQVALQDLLIDHDVEPFDVVSMLNTYRGWQSADLRTDEKWMPAAMDEWLRWHARYAIVTTHERQDQIDAGFWVKRIGQGEDSSTMVIMFPSGADQWNQ